MKKENRLLTIDGETLMSQPLTPLNFVVDTLLSQGLHILAGSPKVGKSWLALWLAVTVAKGEAVWGMGVKQGTTLYLCLEDSTLRIQNRLFEITEDAPANVHFSTNVKLESTAPLMAVVPEMRLNTSSASSFRRWWISRMAMPWASAIRFSAERSR